ncbi:hypothetical protein SHKM778_86770 [Streptomyces sp. KM77-8]|uniref:Uncharacterized protein n=1 Tax=Streptomyces haneummycinicus TaxID=3074435 RepID=A0AAT9HYM2_9ACTN
MAEDQAGEEVGQGVGVGADLRAGAEHLRERDALTDQRRRHLQQAPADVDDLLAVDTDIAEVQRRREVLRGDLAREVVGEFLGSEADRGLLGGGVHAEEVAHVPAVVEGLGELGYPVQGVAALQQCRDRAQPGQMPVVVPGDTPLPARWRDQSALAVEPQGAHGDAGQPGQLVHAVLASRS